MSAGIAVAFGRALASTTLTSLAYLREHDAAAAMPALSMRRPLHSLHVLTLAAQGTPHENWIGEPLSHVWVRVGDDGELLAKSKSQLIIPWLPAEDGSCDAAVASLVLCSVPDPSRALAELRRVLRPGGELRFYEHILSDRPGLARVQRTVDRLFWPRAFGGCHAARDTPGAISAAGFAIETSRALWVGPRKVPTPTGPHAIGRARRV